MSGIDLDPASVEAALAARADALRAALEARIKANLSGDVLNVRSGTLINSIDSELDDDGSTVTVTVGSSGVPYAGILEFGGKSAAHDIVAVKAKALMFLAGGQQRFAKVVHHPGSTIPAFGYLGRALDVLKGEIRSGLKDAVLEALGAG